MAASAFPILNAQTIDILPTVADVLGIRVPWHPGGTSLLSGASRGLKTLYYDAARRSVTFPASSASWSSALAHKLALFGESGNPDRVPRPARYADLVGQPLDWLDVHDGGGRVAVADLSAFDRIAPKRDEAPFDVLGRLEDLGPVAPTYVAVSVNGVIRAVTRTWSSQPSVWLATPPLSAWRPGANRLQVLVVESTPDGPVLLRTEVHDGEPVS